jgi:quercetin dioxygenase-like cupin family protein
MIGEKKTLLFLILSLGIVFMGNAQVKKEIPATNSVIFPRGEKAPSLNMTGNVWLYVLTPADSVFTQHIASVTFEPGARTHWHSHPGGQILLIIDGIGFYQEKDQPIQILRKGDVRKCAPGTEHWHGATPDSHFVHIGITNPSEKGRTLWLQPVDDDEYGSAIKNLKAK